MKRHITAAALITALAASSPAWGQEATNMPAGTRHAITVDAGLDSAMATSAGYTYRLRAGFWKHDILLYGKLTLPAGDLDLDDNAVEAGIRTTAVAYGNLRLQIALGPVLRNTESNLFAANSLGFQTTLLPGYQSERWGLMAEIGYEKMLATNLRHSQLYRDTFYPEAENGWYGNTAGTVRLGLRAGLRIGAVQLSMRAGVVSSEGGNPHLPPFYHTVGLSHAF